MGVGLRREEKRERAADDPPGPRCDRCRHQIPRPVDAQAIGGFEIARTPDSRFRQRGQFVDHHLWTPPRRLRAPVHRRRARPAMTGVAPSDRRPSCLPGVRVIAVT